MPVSIDIDDQQYARLADLAQQLEVDVAELARAAFNDLVSRAADDFERAATLVLGKTRARQECGTLSAAQLVVRPC